MNGRNAARRFVEVLCHAREGTHAIAVYANDSDLDDYEVGFVEEVDDNNLVLLALTSKGEADGRQIIPVQDVHRIDSDTEYTRRIQLLHEYRESILDREFPPIPDGLAKTASSLLEYAKREGFVVNVVDRHGFGPSGFVKSVEEDHVEVERLNGKGEPDGTAVMMLEVITRVHIGRREEQVLNFLYRYNHGLKKLLEG